MTHTSINVRVRDGNGHDHTRFEGVEFWERLQLGLGTINSAEDVIVEMSDGLKNSRFYRHTHADAPEVVMVHWARVTRFVGVVQQERLARVLEATAAMVRDTFLACCDPDCDACVL